MDFPVLVFYSDGGMIHAQDINDATQTTLNAIRQGALNNMTIVDVNGILHKLTTARRASKLESLPQKLLAHMGGIVRVELIPAGPGNVVSLDNLKEMVYSVLSINAKEDKIAARQNRQAVKCARSFAEVIEIFQDRG